MGKFLILSVADHEEHILNKIMEALADEPELDHIALPLSDDTLPFPELEIRLSAVMRTAHRRPASSPFFRDMAAQRCRPADNC